MNLGLEHTAERKGRSQRDKQCRRTGKSLLLEKEIPAAYQRHLETRQRSILDEAGRSRALTFRGFWVGSFLSFFLAIGAPYGNMIIRGSYMALDFSTPGAIFLFLILIGVVNLLFKLAGENPRPPLCPRRCGGLDPYLLAL